MAAPRTVVSFDAMPEALKDRKQWCMWKLELSDKGKLTKIPYNPANYKASSTDSDTWASFEEVKAAYRSEQNNFAGVGFFFNNDFTGNDFDHCLAEGSIQSDRLKVSDKLVMDCLNKLSSYTGISQSGTGLHTISKPGMSADMVRHKTGDFEMYSSGRFFVMTGNVPPSAPTTIRENPDALAEVYHAIFDKQDVAKNEPSSVVSVDASGADYAAADNEVVVRICKSKQVEKFMKLFRGDTSGYLSESEADAALAAIIGFYNNKNFAQTLRMISQSKLWDEKWQREDYQQRTINGAFAKLTKTYGGNSTGQKAIEALPLEVVEAGYKADPDSITSPAALETLRQLSVFKLAGFFKKLQISGDQKKILVNLLKPDQTAEEPQIASDILTEANQILDAGKGFKYVHDVWQKRHHGDENLGKGLFLSIGAQSCISSKGVHVHACGPRGSGKSDGAEKASEAIPGSHLLVGSASPKALYYLGERLPAGAVVYLDDIGWNDQAAQMFKTCTTFYREGATHTVVVDQEIMQFKTAPRIIFWLTTADDQTDEQIRDRLLRIDTTETTKHTKEVIDFIFSQRKSDAACFDTRELEVCQAIIYLLKQVFIDVVIPFSGSIRFEGDPRGATIFADLVSSFAIWRHRIRARDTNDAVIASYEDYHDAETFFNAIKGHGDTKYTPREMRVLQAIKDLHGEATREMVMAKTGLSKGDLSDILNGRSRDGQAKYGLFHKCAALTEDEVGTSTQLEDTKKTRTSIKKKTLRLPKDYDTLSAYGKAVYLADETTIKQTCSASSEQFGNGSEIKNEFGKDVVRKFVEYNIIREKRKDEPKHKLSPVDGGKNLFSHQRAKSAELPNSEPLDTGLPFRTTSEPDPNQVRTKPIDADISIEEQAKAKDEHFRKVAEEHTGKPPLICAKCGEDLTGHGQITKGEKVYCCKVGCGYPAREEAKAN